VLAPTARTLLAAVADDRVPVAIRLFLVVGRDLEGERLGLLERRAAVEADTGNPYDGELHDELIAGLAARKVTRRLVGGGDFGIRKRGGVEARGFLRVVVEPETDHVLRLHPVLTFSVISLFMTALRRSAVATARPASYFTFPASSATIAGSASVFGTSRPLTRKVGVASTPPATP